MRCAALLLAVALSACAGAIPAGAAPSRGAAAWGSVERPGAAGGRIGTGAPFLLRAWAPDGRWVVLCEARADTDHDGELRIVHGDHGVMLGDTLEPYLVLGSGAGERIDALLSVSTDSRWLAVRRADRVEVIDTITRRRAAIGAMPREDATPLVASPGVDVEAGRAVVVRDGGIELHDLVAETRRSISLGAPGLLYAARLSEGGGFVHAYYVPRDTDGDGTLEPPEPITTLQTYGTCHGPPMSASFSGWRGDEADVRIGRANDDTLAPGDGVLGTIGDALLRATEEGALEIVRAGGGELAGPAGCDPELLHSSGAPLAVAAHCRTTHVVGVWREGQGWRDVAVLAPSDLATSIGGEPVVSRELASGVIVVLNRRERGDVAIDLHAAVARELEDDLSPVTAHAHALVVTRGTELSVLDVRGGDPVALVPGGRVRGVAGPVLATEVAVFSIATGARLGTYLGPLHGVAVTGQLLVGHPDGGLAWRAPMPSIASRDEWNRGFAD